MRLGRRPRTRHPGRMRGRIRQRAYLLPSALTIGNMLLGFLAVVQGLDGRFELAAVLIFCAGLLDALDGRIARMTGTTSDFGAEYDSLADVITFGMAPALLCHLWGLDELGRVGWLVPLFYLVCTATRLARFNVQLATTDPRWFVGLPTPAAAGAACSVLLFVPHPEALDPDLRWGVSLGLLAVLVALGALMVSTFRYHSLKVLDLKKARSYRVMVPVAAVVLVAAVRPTAFFLSAATLYTFSGPVAWLWSRLRRKAPAGQAEDAAEDGGEEHAAKEPTA